MGAASLKKQKKCATFLHVAGDNVIRVFNIMDFDDDVDDVLKEVLNSFGSIVSQRGS